MRADEFLTMMEQDLATHKDREQLTAVLDVMREVLKGSTADIDPRKTVEGCFRHMRNYASKKQKNNCYYMGPAESCKVVAEYLGVTYGVTGGVTGGGQVSQGGIVNLDDFI